MTAATSAPPKPYVSRVRRLPVPVTDPPYDDELGIVLPRGDRRPPDGRPAAGTPVQGALPLDLEPDDALEELLRPIGDEPAVADSLWLRDPGPEPPVAGEEVAVTPRRAGAGSGTAGARSSTTPPVVAPEPAGAPQHAGVTAPAGDTAGDVAGAAGDGPGVRDLPDPRRWTARLAQSALECLHGRRPVQQLIRWTAEPVYRDLSRTVAAQEEAPVPAARPRIRSLRVCRVTASVAEASVVVQVGPAVRAVAVRLEADDGRWLCTAFEVVEPGPVRRPARGRRQREAQASSNAPA